METILAILAFLVLAPCLGELRLFVKRTLRDINEEPSTSKK